MSSLKRTRALRRPALSFHSARSALSGFGLQSATLLQGGGGGPQDQGCAGGIRACSGRLATLTSQRRVFGVQVQRGSGLPMEVKDFQ